MRKKFSFINKKILNIMKKVMRFIRAYEKELRIIVSILDIIRKFLLVYIRY